MSKGSRLSPSKGGRHKMRHCCGQVHPLVRGPRPAASPSRSPTAAALIASTCSMLRDRCKPRAGWAGQPSSNHLQVHLSGPNTQVSTA
jgi:hypothetical protein